MNEQQQNDHDAIIRFEGKLDSILLQVTKTNGRVTKSEDDIKALSNWRYGIAGGLFLIGFVGVPMLLALLNDVKIDGELIKTHIAQTIK